ncbi:MAG: Gfo/Idh/MocA family oxidoreductase [Draconibacterium sp.]|nr:Gfo/Idh/MocA family oxidoreductase [Draconibacterium sp.]
MKIWNFGIVGAGNIADFHAKAIQSLDNAKLIGICGTNPNKVKMLATKYSCKVFNDINEIVQSPDIDVIIVATPSGAHLIPAVEAAKQGKHVLCEKPLEISLERVDTMIKSHEKYNTKLGGIFNFRFNDVVRVLKNAVDSGRFGTITNASVFVPWWRNNEYYKSSWRGTWELDGGGALMNQSIHMVDLLQYMVGPVDSLKAYIATLGHPQIKVEDSAVAILKFKNKALGMIYGTTASFPGQFRRLEITGTKGTVIMEENSFKVWQFAEPVDEDPEIIKKYSTIEGGGGVSDPMAIPFEPLARNIAAFIRSIEERKPFEIDGKEARKSVEIVLGIYKSAKEHKEVFFS